VVWKLSWGINISTTPLLRCDSNLIGVPQSSKLATDPRVYVNSPPHICNALLRMCTSTLPRSLPQHGPHKILRVWLLVQASFLPERRIHKHDFLASRLLSLEPSTSIQPTIEFINMVIYYLVCLLSRFMMTIGSCETSNEGDLPRQ